MLKFVRSQVGKNHLTSVLTEKRDVLGAISLVTGLEIVLLDRVKEAEMIELILQL